MKAASIKQSSLKVHGCKLPFQFSWAFSYQFSRHPLQLIQSVSYVEDFWAVWRHLEPPSRLVPGSYYFVFHDTLVPRWESWHAGGRWVHTCSSESFSGDSVDSLWEELVLACVGEQLNNTELVCGICIANRRDGYKFSLWLSDASDMQRVQSLGIQFAQMIAPAEGTQIGFVLNSDSIECSRLRQEASPSCVLAVSADGIATVSEA